jgi:alpha-beta hydrolase superfamily lysophospholipase
VRCSCGVRAHGRSCPADPELDVDAMAASLLDDEQRAALERARQGDHLPLAERGYSTGATVVR